MKVIIRHTRNWRTLKISCRIRQAQPPSKKPPSTMAMSTQMLKLKSWSLRRRKRRRTSLED